MLDAGDLFATTIPIAQHLQLAARSVFKRTGVTGSLSIAESAREAGKSRGAAGFRVVPSNGNSCCSLAPARCEGTRLACVWAAVPDLSASRRPNATDCGKGKICVMDYCDHRRAGPATGRAMERAATLSRGLFCTRRAALRMRPLRPSARSQAVSRCPRRKLHIAAAPSGARRRQVSSGHWHPEQHSRCGRKLRPQPERNQG